MDGLPPLHNLRLALACALAVAGSFAVLSGRFEGSGGPYLYTTRLWGPRVGAGVGWVLVSDPPLGDGDFGTGLRGGDRGRLLVVRAATGRRGAPRGRFACVALTGVLPSVRVGNAIGQLKLLALTGFAVVGAVCALHEPTVVQAPFGAAHSG